MQQRARGQSGNQLWKALDKNRDPNAKPEKFKLTPEDCFRGLGGIQPNRGDSPNAGECSLSARMLLNGTETPPKTRPKRDRNATEKPTGSSTLFDKKRRRVVR